MSAEANNKEPEQPSSETAPPSPDTQPEGASAEMIDAPSEDETPESVVVVKVSEDRLKAWVRLCDPDAPHPETIAKYVAALQRARVHVDDSVRGRLRAFIEVLEGEEPPPDQYLVAEGDPAVEGRDGEFIWDESIEKKSQDWQADAPIDHYSFNSVVTVEAGARIGRTVPAVPGKNGFDVYRNLLKPNRRPVDVKLDSSVRLADDDQASVSAAIAGKVKYQSHTVSIDPVFMVNGNVDYEVGNIDSTISVDIKGTVLDQFSVKSKESVAVGGLIESAHVEAGGDVVVRGGIVGRGQGTIQAGGDIIAKFADEAELRAGGSIKIAKELIHSRVNCDGRFVATRGAIIGGHVYAREGVEAATLGSNVGVPTAVIVGIHPDVLREADAIRDSVRAKQKTIERVRAAVEPLMANLKRLAPAQKESATELLYQAEVAEGEIKEEESRREKMIEEARATDIPYVQVGKTLYQGARIRIGHRRVVFNEPLSGPVRIEKRKMDRVTEFVAVNQTSGSVSVLKSSATEDDDESGSGTQTTEEVCSAGHGPSD